jgi:hypothetical protein
MAETGNNAIGRDVPWWLHPIPIFVGLNGVTGVASYFAGPSTYVDLWRTPKYVTLFTLLLIIAVLVVFSGGVWAALANQEGESSKGDWRGFVSLPLTMTLFNISYWISVGAYVFWAGIGIWRGLGWTFLKSVFSSADVNTNVYSVRTYLATIPGITTLTQLGIAAVILGSLIGAGLGWKVVRGKLALLFTLAILRALIYSERLAFLELLIPLLVLRLVEPAPNRSPAMRRLIRFAPILGIVAVYFVFTGFETVRSWTIYYSSRESSLWLFGFWRLVGYYVTAFNNSAYVLSTLRHSLGAPFLTMNFLWQFPVINVYVKDLFSWVHLDYEGYMNLLAAGANPEFNNWGGLLSPVIDFGVVGALIYWAFMGLITGTLYSLCLRKHPLGLCIYPVVYLALSEVPRYLYWGEGRAFPALAYLLVSVVFLLQSATLFPSRSAHTLRRDSRAGAVA